MNTLLIESTNASPSTTRKTSGDTRFQGLTTVPPRVRILYVDDDDGIRELGQEVLERQGYQVTVVADGREALAALLDGQYQMLITNHNMPHLTGLELVAQTRKAGLRLPIVMTTGFVDLSQIPTQLRSAITALLPKPFVAAELVGTVFRILNGKKDAGPAELALKAIVSTYSSAQTHRYWGINE